MRNFIGLISYVVNFMATLAVIYLVPSDAASLFLKNYSISNIIFSLFLTIIFSYRLFFKNINSILWATYIFIFVSGGLYVWAADEYLLYLMYPVVILLADYSCSQKLGKNEIFYFRVILAISTGILLLPIKFEMALFLRINFICLFIFMALIKNCDVRMIKLKSGIGFLLGVYISYSLVLYLVACIKMDPEILKKWYVAVQIGLVCKLKLMDFNIRNYEYVPMVIIYVAPIVFLFSLITINFFHLNILASLLFVTGYAGLTFVERKYMYEKNT